jgi:hypothetical protein
MSTYFTFWKNKIFKVHGFQTLINDFVFFGRGQNFSVYKAEKIILCCIKCSDSMRATSNKKVARKSARAVCAN